MTYHTGYLGRNPVSYRFARVPITLPGRRLQRRPNAAQYAAPMGSHADERAVLVALLRARAGGWARVASDVAFAGSARAVWDSTDEEALFELPKDESAIEAALVEIIDWESRGLTFATMLEADYPQRLLGIRETPPFLFYQGDLQPQDEGMSVVGSRDASPEGIAQAGEVARFLVDQGLTVIGGLAAGVDTAGHRAALDAGGRTVAFIGTGIARVYPPQNADLQEEIAQQGLVLSQFYPDASPSKQSFPMRNASMSGYGLATIVIEAGERSGTRIQARLAGQHGRPVILTSNVAATTSWGDALRGSPGVYVVEDIDGLKRAVQEIRDRPRKIDQALAALAGA